MRGPALRELIENAPLAFTLAAIIAMRARHSPGISIKGLCRGEALIGDYEKFGMTRQQYRTALRQLNTWGFATIKTTRRGTIAKLTDSRLFDVLSFSDVKQINQHPTNSQPLSKNGRMERSTPSGETFSQVGKPEATCSKPFRKRVPASYKEVAQYGMSIGAPLLLAARFVRYNNAQWLCPDWKRAFRGLKARCEEDGSGKGYEAVGDVPQDWEPEIVPPHS